MNWKKKYLEKINEKKDIIEEVFEPPLPDAYFDACLGVKMMEQIILSASNEKEALAELQELYNTRTDMSWIWANYGI